MENTWSRAISLRSYKEVPRSGWRAAPIAWFIWPRLDREPFLVCRFLPGMDLLSYRIWDALLWWSTFAKEAHGIDLIINVLLRRHGYLWTWLERDFNEVEHDRQLSRPMQGSAAMSCVNDKNLNATEVHQGLVTVDISDSLLQLQKLQHKPPSLSHTMKTQMNHA